MNTFYAQYKGGVFGGGGGGGGSGTAPKANRQAIGSGVSSVAVVFASAFSGNPVVNAWLTNSGLTPDILAIEGVSVTTAGFTAILSTATTDTTFTLNWIASEVNDS